MNTRGLIILLVDLLMLTLAFLVMVAYKPGSMNYLTVRYLSGFGLLLISWSVTSIYFKKYRLKRKNTLTTLLKRIFISNLAALSVVSIFIISFSISGYSRLVFLGTVGIATILEIFIGNLYFLLIHTNNGHTDLINPPPKNYELRQARAATNYKEHMVSNEAIKNAIVHERGIEAYEFISRNTNTHSPEVLMVSTTTRFNIEYQPDDFFTHIINLKRVNDIQYINKFFETINRKIPMGGLFTGMVETKNQRKKRILRKFPPVINWFVYFIDFIIKRVFPKFLLTKKIYFLLTRGNNRVITKAETLGRLYSCGFKIVDEADIDNYFYFTVKKVDEPAYDFNPSYGPFIKLSRVGKGGKLIKVYKLRTMHPYAEYLQSYIYDKYKLDEGGKYKNDFRVSTIGKIFRTFWLDEFPMVFNILKGQIKLVGVRPLSQEYYNLYSKELQEKRIKHKPGLIPPFYADMPKSLEEIMDSELKYIEAFEKHPFRTNWRYFWKAGRNIVFKRARSK